MTIDHGSIRRTRTVRVGVVSAATLALTLSAFPMVATSSAQAVSPGKCDVEATRPVQLASNRQVRYAFKFECPRGYRVEVQQRMYEDDNGPDQFTSGPYNYMHRFNKDNDWDGSKTVRPPDTERGDEEVYHIVRWREYDRKDQPSKWYRTTSSTRTVTAP